MLKSIWFRFVIMHANELGNNNAIRLSFVFTMKNNYVSRAWWLHELLRGTLFPDSIRISKSPH